MYVYCVSWIRFPLGKINNYLLILSFLRSGKAQRSVPPLSTEFYSEERSMLTLGSYVSFAYLLRAEYSVNLKNVYVSGRCNKLFCNNYVN